MARVLLASAVVLPVAAMASDHPTALQLVAPDQPEDAYRCFMRTEMDYLVLEDFILDKRAQPALEESGDWRQEFVPD